MNFVCQIDPIGRTYLKTMYNFLSEFDRKWHCRKAELRTWRLGSLVKSSSPIPLGLHVPRNVCIFPRSRFQKLTGKKICLFCNDSVARCKGCPRILLNQNSATIHVQNLLGDTRVRGLRNACVPLVRCSTQGTNQTKLRSFSQTNLTHTYPLDSCVGLKSLPYVVRDTSGSRVVSYACVDSYACVETPISSYACVGTSHAEIRTQANSRRGKLNFLLRIRWQINIFRRTRGKFSQVTHVLTVYDPNHATHTWKEIFLTTHAWK